MATNYRQPKLTLRIGVTGHRDVPAAAIIQISERVKQALQMLKGALDQLPHALRACYDSSPAVLRAVSPLAEGADRIFAMEALEAGYELVCFLPFHREEYCKDFSGEASIRQFEELVQQAQTVFELDGVRHVKPNAYEIMGRMMLEHCDLLIAIYDDKREHGEGGTSDIVDIARQRQMPVIWIHPDFPDRIFNVGDTSDAQSLTHEMIDRVVNNLLQPPWLREDEGKQK
jgi:hypothetical protein